MNTVHIQATGTYALPEMPETLKQALTAAVEQHMKGYGLTDIHIAIISKKGKPS